MTIEEAQRDVEAKEQALADAKAALERVKAMEPRYYKYEADAAFYRVTRNLVAKIQSKFGVSITAGRKYFPNDFFGREATEIPASEFHAAAREALSKTTEALALPDTRKSPEEIVEEYVEAARKITFTEGHALLVDIIRRDREGK